MKIYSAIARLSLLVVGLWTIIQVACACAQTPIAVPFDSDRWNTENADFALETYEGKESILIRQGSVLLEDVAFLNGTIDVDISFPAERAFPGIAFRMQDMGTYENVYVRPHASGAADATQYTPVFNGVSAWQLYHGDGFTAPATFRHDAWHHLRIVVQGMVANVFLDDMETPLIQVARLKGEPQAGMIGLMGSMEPVRFANFRYSLSEAPVDTPAPETPEPGTITEWQISNLARDTMFETATLTDDLKAALTWTRQQSEPTGLVNLARFAQRREGYNTIVARLDVVSEREQSKPLLFGFSDIVLVYVNDRLVYRGADLFQSRDERFLGTIGYHDGLFLPLKEGLNSVWFVVHENFGGWGVQARFMDMDGIEVQ